MPTDMTKTNVRMTRREHDRIADAAERRHLSINRYLLESALSRCAEEDRDARLVARIDERFRELTGALLDLIGELAGDNEIRHEDLLSRLDSAFQLGRQEPAS